MQITVDEEPNIVDKEPQQYTNPLHPDRLLDFVLKCIECFEQFI